MVLLGGLELVAVGYLLNDYNKSRRRREEEEDEAARKTSRRRRRHSDEADHRPHHQRPHSKKQQQPPTSYYQPPKQTATRPTLTPLNPSSSHLGPPPNLHRPGSAPPTPYFSQDPQYRPPVHQQWRPPIDTRVPQQNPGSTHRPHMDPISEAGLRYAPHNHFPSPPPLPNQPNYPHSPVSPLYSSVEPHRPPSHSVTPSQTRPQTRPAPQYQSATPYPSQTQSQDQHIYTPPPQPSSYVAPPSGVSELAGGQLAHPNPARFNNRRRRSSPHVHFADDMDNESGRSTPPPPYKEW